MSVIKRMLKQKVVYWAPSKGRDTYGNPKLGAAVELKARWEDRNEQFLDEVGEERMSKALIYVESDVKLGGYLWLGALPDAPEDPKTDKDAMVIARYDKLPDFNVKNYLRTAYV